MTDLQRLAADLERQAGTIRRRTASAVAKRTQEAADGFRKEAPSNSIRASVVTDFGDGGLTGEARPTSPLSHLFEYGTAPRTQQTTGRYTGVMPPRPYVDKVAEPVTKGFLDDVKRLAHV